MVVLGCRRQEEAVRPRERLDRPALTGKVSPEIEALAVAGVPFLLSSGRPGVQPLLDDGIIVDREPELVANPADHHLHREHRWPAPIA